MLRSTEVTPGSHRANIATLRGHLLSELRPQIESTESRDEGSELGLVADPVTAAMFGGNAGCRAAHGVQLQPGCLPTRFHLWCWNFGLSGEVALRDALRQPLHSWP
ncbi:hypothetical protein B296_00048630 [Ensete ventricosum]|uniref:Uncharacterized protein n=1 Tax=Ensete ventricosum TaxID=4639 RepID=A0A426X8M0_ENSVE|nr:hypothetical protein B296_00048630 [Ensete ventricosum]